MLTDLDYDVVNGVPMTCFKGINDARLYLVHTLAEWAAFYELLNQQEMVACDTETSGFQYATGDKIVGLSFGWGKYNFYIPLRHIESVTGGIPPAQLDMDDIREDLQKFFARQDVFTLWHNWKFDAHFYRADGVEILTPFHDTLILWKFFDENGPAALKDICSGWTDLLGRRKKGLIGPKANKLEKAVGKWRTEESRARQKQFNAAVMTHADFLQKDPAFQSYNRNQLKKYIKEREFLDHPDRGVKKADIHYGYIPVPLMTEYAGLDTFFTNAVYTYVMKNVSFSKKRRKLYINEIKMARAIMEAESVGIGANREYLEELKIQYEAEISSLTTEVQLTLGNINLGSNPQLSEAFIAAGVPLTKKTDGAPKCVNCQADDCNKHYKTDAKALGRVALGSPIVDKVLELRTVTKLHGTYVQGILERLAPDNTLHCSFNQNVVTGRMSSRDPNLQNIPGRDKSIRAAFPCPPGEWLYLFADYSQVELRLTTHYSQDILLLDAYAKDQDIHTRTLCEMFGHKYEEVVKVFEKGNEHPLFTEYTNLRTIAKRINFGIIYGVGAPGLSEQIPRPEEYAHLSYDNWVKVCQRYIDNYLDTYLGVQRFVNQGKRTVRRHASVENFFGRIRNLPHARAVRILKQKDMRWLEAKAGRQGVNFLIQGTAADLFKFAVVRVHDLLKDWKSHIVNFVHDEIQIYLHKSEFHLVPLIKATMEDFPEFSVPILVDLEFSVTNWAEKQKI